MNLKLRLNQLLKLCALFLLLACFNSFTIQAQTNCAAGSTATPIFLETFGTGKNPGPQLKPGLTNYPYVAGWPTDGQYTIATTSNPDSGGNPFWHTKRDHTGGGIDTTGYMMVVNAAGAPGEFYRQQITGLCQKTTFVCSVWAANVNSPNITSSCSGGNPCRYPNILIKIENTTGTVLSQIQTGQMPYDSVLTWRQYSLIFQPQAGQSTVYFVLVNNGQGGQGNDLVLDDISFRICLPNVDVKTDAKVCEGENATITANIQPGFNTPQMQWQVSSDNGGTWTDMPGDTSKNLIVKKVKLPPPVLKYRVLVAERGNVQQKHCRVVSNEIELNIVPSPVADISNVNPATCGNSSGTASVKLTSGTPAYTFSWLPVGATTQSISGLSPGTYTVTVLDMNGCKDTATAKVIDGGGKLVVTASINSNVSCKNGNDGKAQVTATGGSGDYTYLWSPGGQTTNIITGLTAGTYSVTVKDKYDCTSIQTLTISEPPLLALDASGTGVNCIATGTIFSGAATVAVSGGTSNYTYLWTPGNYTTPSISNLLSGTYSVLVTDSKGCTATDSTTIVVAVKPDALFSTVSKITCEGIKLEIKDESSPIPISTWEWDFGDGGKSDEQNPNHTFPYDGKEYVVKLIVSRPPCKDTVQSKFFIGTQFDYTKFEPANVFTPNWDGKNDCFTPALRGDGADELRECTSLIVFDRWGIKMFESMGSDNCWNGNTVNGKPAVDGMYYYYSTLGKRTIGGYVQLLRQKP